MRYADWSPPWICISLVGVILAPAVAVLPSINLHPLPGSGNPTEGPLWITYYVDHIEL